MHTNKKKALIITYYWPPSSGAGIYRWLKMSRYMKDNGWEPVIYTPSNPSVARTDESLINDVPDDIEVLKYPIVEPLELYTKFTSGNKKGNIGTGLLSAGKKSSWKLKLLFWIRGNFFIPDPRRFWVRPSFRFLKKYLDKNPVNVIITTGPPHSLHLIGLKLAKKRNIKWVADFRDPWTNIDFYDQLNLSKLADKINHKLERTVLQKADRVVTVSNHWAQELKDLGAEKVSVITNGYDHEEFANVKPQIDPEKFTLIHVGSMNNDRNPQVLWESLGQLMQDVPSFKEALQILLIGDVDYRVFEELDRNNLKNNTLHIPYVKHKEIIQYLVNSSVLCLPLNNTPNVLGIIPGKLFEYLAAQRVILAIGPLNGDSASIIEETNGGVVIDYNDENGMYKAIHTFFEKHRVGKLISESEGITKYSRQNLSKEFCHLLDQVIESGNSS